MSDGPYTVSTAFQHLWPGGLAVAERLWSAREVADWRSAKPRLEAQMERLERRVHARAERGGGGQEMAAGA